jgi:hypothetical protein
VKREAITMKPAAVLALAFAFGTFAAAPWPAAAQAAAGGATSCAPSGDLHFVCGLTNVEDLVAVDGGRWLVGSSFAPGPVGLYLIDTASKTARPAALSIAPTPDPRYAGCAAPDLKGLSTHGLDAVPGSGGNTTIFAINHGGRESVEVFRLNAAKGSAAWVGCVLLPEGTSGNSIVALPNGSLAVSKFQQSGDSQAIQHILAGMITGVVYLWSPGKGFSEMPGTRFSGDNGLVVSRDGKWLFVNAWGTQEVHRLPLDGKGTGSSVKVEFHPDNLRWAPDGKILVTGQFLNPEELNGRHGWATVRLDPQTMAITPAVNETGLPQFDDATVAVQAGKALWFGTFRGDRIAYRALP